MATATAKVSKPRSKFPLDKEKQSKTFLSSNVTTLNYTTNPKLEITIKTELDSTVISDLTNAIDEVLKFHGL